MAASKCHPVTPDVRKQVSRQLFAVLQRCTAVKRCRLIWLLTDVLS